MRASQLIVWASVLIGCAVPELDPEGKACPCLEPYVCSPATNQCVRTDNTRYGMEVAADAPLGWWRFEESSGARLFDETGNGNDCDVVGGVTLGVPGAVAGSNGVQLDGSSGAITCGDRFDFVGPATYSLELWVRVDRVGSTAALFDKEAGAGGTPQRNGYLLLLENESAGRVDLASERWRDGSLSGRPTGFGLIGLGSFAHVVATFDGTQETLYVDGVEAGNHSIVNELTDNTGAFTMGAGSGADHFFLAASIDEAAVYGVALPPARIAAHFDARN